VVYLRTGGRGCRCGGSEALRFAAVLEWWLGSILQISIQGVGFHYIEIVIFMPSVECSQTQLSSFEQLRRIQVRSSSLNSGRT
jgi:hypothetical protein